MIWRLDCMTQRGVQGTVLGTLVMPYCSGIGNLVFVFLIGRDHGPGAEVITNCLVNNVTNMTLVIGVPALCWGMTIVPDVADKPAHSSRRKRKDEELHRLNRLDLLLTLTAVMFFTGALWALTRDGRLDFGDGLVLVGLFLFWQCFHVFEVLKENVRQKRSFSWLLVLDITLLLIGGYGVYLSVDWLVEWLSSVPTGFLSAKYLGWLTGWLMVLPNALLAIYYGWRGRPDIIYTSQVGDGHICIPLCVGIGALFQTVRMPHSFELGMALIFGACVLHFILVAALGRLPRVMGLVLIGAYGLFLYLGLFR